MTKKYCWKCQQISEFEACTLEYVANKTGGTMYVCKSCNDAWRRENNIKKVNRIETPDSLFSCRYEYEYFEDEKNGKKEE